MLRTCGELVSICPISYLFKEPTHIYRTKTLADSDSDSDFGAALHGVRGLTRLSLCEGICLLKKEIQLSRYT